MSAATKKMIHPDNGANTVNIEGQTYQAGDDGAFEVPADKAHLLVSHGFIEATDEVKAAKLEKVTKTGDSKAANAGNLKKAE